MHFQTRKESNSIVYSFPYSSLFLLCRKISLSGKQYCFSGKNSGLLGQNALFGSLGQTASFVGSNSPVCQNKQPCKSGQTTLFIGATALFEGTIRFVCGGQTALLAGTTRFSCGDKPIYLWGQTA